MTPEPEESDLKARMQRLETWNKTRSWVFLCVLSVLALQLWSLAHPGLFQTGAVRARKFTVVDEKGKTTAEFGAQNGVSYVSFYDGNYKPQVQIAVTQGEGSRILLWDKDQHQRVLLEVSDSPRLVLHDSDSQVRALLAADDNGTTFWVKDKKGFATVLGNGPHEARKIERSSGQPLVVDTVETSSGASIVLTDSERRVVWKAP